MIFKIWVTLLTIQLYQKVRLKIEYRSLAAVVFLVCYDSRIPNMFFFLLRLEVKHPQIDSHPRNLQVKT